MFPRRIAPVLLLFAVWLMVSAGSALAVTLPFHDGFENVPVGAYPSQNGWHTWTSGVTAHVSNAAAYSGTRSFLLHSYSYWTRSDCVSLEAIPDLLTYQASIYMDPYPGRSATLGLADDPAGQRLYYNSFSISSGNGSAGFILFWGATRLPPRLVGNFAVGEWVTLRADLDFTKGTADLWLDGASVATAVPIQPREFNDSIWGHIVLDRFAVAESNWSGGATGVIYVDDVALFDPSVPAFVEAAIDIDPDTLNLRSRGQWVTCYIELPEGYSVEDIDVGSLLLLEAVAAEPRPVNVGDYDADGVPDLMVKFSRSALAALLSPGDQEIVLTGFLMDGTPLVGSDTIRVIR